MKKKEELEAAARGEGCIGKSQDDEPIFTLVARDRFAPAVVRRWADLVEAATHPNSTGRRKAVEARLFAVEMDAWREAHGGGKVPD